MAKTIKFNLDCGGESIRTLEDLQNHFQIEDVINYYHDGLLQRWLKVHDYEDELKAVKAVHTVANAARNLADKARNGIRNFFSAFAF